MARREKALVAQSVLLSVADVAAALGVCRQTVYNFIYREGLPSIKVRGTRRVRPEALQQWLISHEEQFA